VTSGRTEKFLGYQVLNVSMIPSFKWVCIKAGKRLSVKELARASIFDGLFIRFVEGKLEYMVDMYGLPLFAGPPMIKNKGERSTGLFCNFWYVPAIFLNFTFLFFFVKHAERHLFFQVFSFLLGDFHFSTTL
jgi:hypothetical protein